MSAYMVDREHIQYLLDAAMSRRIFSMHGSAMRWSDKALYCSDYALASEVGQMLWDENKLSIQHLYPDCSDDNMPGPIGDNFIYGRHTPSGVPIDPVQVLMSCHCYSYQSCEHPGWQESEAKQFIDRLEKAAIQAIPGYSDAQWGAPDECYKQSTVR